MLGAIKRRWKPRRDSAEKENNNQVLKKKTNQIKNENNITVDMTRIAPSQRQIHPVIEDNVHLVAYSDTDDALPPTPNICVEGGRIEFVRSPSDGSTCTSGTSYRNLKGLTARVASSTTSGSLSSAASCAEKSDLAKEVLEARIRELERLLEAEQQAGQRERLAVTRLQRQLGRREVIHRDVERERRRRVDTENKCKEAASEAQRYKNSLAKLQKEFNRMEESVRSMVHLKNRCDVLTQEKCSLSAAYESRVQTYQHTIGKLSQENDHLRQQLRMVRSYGDYPGMESGDLMEQIQALEADNASYCQEAEAQRRLHERCLERLRVLEVENANLCQDSETARRQYERCLDDIANQVVRALLSQKGLREEIGNLQRRIKDLETQNQALANILVHRLSRGGDGEPWLGMFSPSPLLPESQMSTPSRARLLLESASGTPMEDARRLSLLFLPVQRPRSLHLESFSAPVTSGRRTHRRNKPAQVPVKKPTEDEGNESPESGNRDEGYSTMSSDVQVLGETSEVSRLGLEDLKEATDEGEDVCTETLVLPATGSQRNSFPPFQQSQHVMRSFSDSHLCLRGTAISLRRSRLHRRDEGDDSGGESVASVGSGWWDQQWLRLDDSRQLEMDRSEVENWSLSCEDVAQGLPSIRELEDGWSSGDSSCAASLVSERSEPSGAVGTDFTRDFYRLVKFESTRSLESSSSRSHGVLEGQRDVSYDRELALQSVLNFIAEQQQYCHSREEEDDSLTATPLDEAPKDCYRTEKDCEDSGKSQDVKCEKLQRTENFSKCLESQCVKSVDVEEQLLVPVTEEEEEEAKEVADMTESLTSSLSTPDTVVGATKVARSASPLKIKSEIPSGSIPNQSRASTPKRRCNRETKIPVISTRKMDASSPRRSRPERNLLTQPQPSSNCVNSNTSTSSTTNISVTVSYTPVLSPKHTSPSSNIPLASTTIPIARRAANPRKISPESVLVVGPSTLSIHERASSKDVIEELNRMIRKGDEPSPVVAEVKAEDESKPLDLACARPTGWVHVERDIDFTDPKARANLLDVMLASSGSSEGDSESGGEEFVDYSHLHRLHRFRRHKKAVAVRRELGVLGAVRWSSHAARPSIVGRDGFFVRYGRAEQDAVATFDFLEDLSTTSISTCESVSSHDAAGSSLPLTLSAVKPEPPQDSPSTLSAAETPLDDSDSKTADLLSFSDSCADSYSSEDLNQ